jgi:hypothetical protein
VQLLVARVAERNQISLVVAPTLASRDEVMMLQIVGRAACGAKT